MEQLFLKLENGVPAGYPILESNLRELVTRQLPYIIKPQDLENTGFVLFEPNDPPEEIDQGLVFETFVEGYERNSTGSYSYKFKKQLKFSGTCEIDSPGNNAMARAYLEDQINNSIRSQVAVAEIRLNSLSLLYTERLALEKYVLELKNIPNQALFPFKVTWPEYPIFLDL
jgi:hypothetical protein